MVVAPRQLPGVGVIMVIDLWTDGSGTTDGNPGGWCAILLATNPVTGEVHEKVVSGFVANATNNRMEMTALLMGLRELKRPSIVVVHTDSEYLMKPFTEGWMTKWIRRGWRKVANDDIWREILVEYNKHMVTFEWVKGHSKVELNEACDAIAGSARKAALRMREVVTA